MSAPHIQFWNGIYQLAHTDAKEQNSKEQSTNRKLDVVIGKIFPRFLEGKGFCVV